MLLIISSYRSPWLYMDLALSHLFPCFTVLFFVLTAQTQRNKETADKASAPAEMNCVQLCDVASNRVQPFSVWKVQMALQPARQIFSRLRFLLYQRGAVNQISLAGPPVL